LIAFFPYNWWWFLAVFLIVLINAGSVKRAGAEGEDVTLEMLSSLPDSYTVLNQVLVPNKASRTGHTEIDFLVIGPNGIFVIEVKNNNGRIVGSEEEREWVAHKVGRKGTPYTAPMKNPIKQLKNQIWALRNFSNERGHRAWIEGLIFFSNPKSSIELKAAPSLPIIQHFGLTNYILMHKSKQAPSSFSGIIQHLVAIDKISNT